MARLDRHPSRYVIALALAALFAAPAPSAAQQMLRPSIAPSAVVLGSGIDTARADGRTEPRVPRDLMSTSMTARNAATQGSSRRGLPWVVGGVAAIVVGAVVQGNVGGALALGGVAAGFYGAWQYISRNDPSTHAAVRATAAAESAR